MTTAGTAVTAVVAVVEGPERGGEGTAAAVAGVDGGFVELKLHCCGVPAEAAFFSFGRRPDVGEPKKHIEKGEIPE